MSLRPILEIGASVTRMHPAEKEEKDNADYSYGLPTVDFGIGDNPFIL